MSSIPRDPDKRDLRYVKLVNGRLYGSSENDIATNADCDSPAELYQQLAKDGFPVCETCGATHVAAGHCDAKGGKRTRQSRSPSAPEELPPATAAAGLFREVIESLTRATENLEHRHEVYQGRRYVGTDVYTDPVYFSREAITEEHWQALCKIYDLDLKEEFLDTNAVTRIPAGASKEPTEPLTTLIGVYALAGGHLEPLLEALHPGEPSAKTLLNIRKCVEGKKKLDKKDGLKALAQQLAILVRGGTVQGAPPDNLDSTDDHVARSITQCREDGWSEEQIYHTYERFGYTRKKLSELGNLRLRWPEG